MKTNSYLKKILNSIFDSFLYRFKDFFLFKYIFNLKSILNHYPVRIVHSSGNFVTIRDHELNLDYLTNSRVRISFLQKGLYFRSSEIATSYGIDLIDFDNGDTVIDIGANWGDLSLFFSLNQSNLKIDYIGIEPGLEEFACLKHNLLDYSSSNYNIAVGSKNETRKFYYSPEKADSSLYQPPNFTREYDIEVFTLDSFLVGLNRKYKTIKLLKIEAEGAEFDVCLGSLQILDSIEYIAADLGFEKGINQETTAPEVKNFLLNHDFEICKLTDIESLRFLFRNKKFK